MRNPLNASLTVAWQSWQDQHPEDAERIRQRFATKAIEHGFRKAERYLITAIAERLDLPWGDVAVMLM